MKSSDLVCINIMDGRVETTDSSHCIVKKLPVDGYQSGISGGAPLHLPN